MGIRSLGIYHVHSTCACDDLHSIHYRDAEDMKLRLVYRPSHIDTFAYSERLGWIRVRCNKCGGGCTYPTFTDGPFNTEIEANAAMRYVVKGIIEQAEGEL